MTARQLRSAALNDDAVFIFPSNDEYWAPDVTVGRHLYEPEIDRVLRQGRDRPYALFDCGANMGYWSVLASSEPYGRHPVVAIEAARANFEVLLMNSRANGGRFSALHRAILDRSGNRVSLYGRRHYGMSLRPDWHPADSGFVEEVETTTLDDIAQTHLPNPQYPPLIKIDVEGSEIEAIQGARRLVQAGALLIYEDHGKEAAHPVSRFVLGRDDIVVWRVTPGDPPTRITTIEQVAAIKQDARMGYNFFAHKRTSPWSSLFHDL